MKKYRAAIIGCGRIASSFSKDPLRKGIITHAHAYLKHPRTLLACACDLDADKLREFGNLWKVNALYTDLRQMLAKEQIDILSICTPGSTHCSVLKVAAEFPIKAIFCEKPLAETVAEAGEMVRLCRDKGIILQVGHQRRFDPLHKELRKIILNGKMGAVQQANFFYTAGIKNTGSHMFDLLRYFLGDASWIESFYSKNKSQRDNDPNLDGLIKFRDGAIATFQGFDVNKYVIFELSCFLEKGKFVLKNSGFHVDFCKVGKSKFFSGYKQLLPARCNLKETYKRDFLYFAIDHLVACVRDRKESISSGEDGLKALSLIQGAIDSADSDGKRVLL